MKFHAYHRPVKGLESPPSRGAWIEIPMSAPFGIMLWSPPSRGAWIEIRRGAAGCLPPRVAPLAGGVD